MEHKYDQLEDFLTDDSFVRYCFRDNENDVSYWESWLNAHPEKQPNVNEAREMVFMLGIKVSPEEISAEWEKMKESAEPDVAAISDDLYFRRGRRRLRWTAGIGILVVILVGVGWLVGKKPEATVSKFLNSAPATVEKEYVAPIGKQRNLVLRDGTKVRLNADSKLTPIINNKKREYTLSGEAYFNVNRDPNKPFIIHTRNMEITVLGTTLNVKDYPEDHRAEATLLTGAILVKLQHNDEKEIRLKPKERLITYSKKVEITPLPADRKPQISSDNRLAGYKVAPLEREPLLDSGTVATAWMENKLVFRDEAFADLANSMSRKYNVKFHFSTKELEEYRFTGIFFKESLQEALEALQLTSPSDPFAFSIRERQVYIRKK